MNLQLHHMSGNRGFSLVELLFVIVIMVIALAPLMDSITASFQSGRLNEEHTLLVNLARQKMEDILAMAYTDVVVGSALSDSVTFPGNTVNRDVLVELYDGDGDSSPDAGLKKITVTIKGVQLVSLLADY